ncbi:FemAB family PEP-CTERM system-associated protein [Erythrobacter sp. SCSIO 43205]|uniref:FemAB family XrtA/PEP-CTERM system-associated protein n=1 Tax=Erythrobacter sp. SCSIO 43205 TaxID=2779361 RepID=UPI001CA9AB0F|nr:FemAB family XrtA/PEP-CTERM system-associated protein [Erythrobacter sp. SCSIO 43205]UAB77268.1 FemAB family PEP-CTERM system-associated protein [Erythrobacter sp. SCSIO 43205]
MNAPVSLSLKAQAVDLADARMCERIDCFVQEMGASVFHRPNWLLAVEKATGQRAGGFVIEQLGVIQGWLPLTEVRSFLFGKALVSSGFGVGGGICAERAEVAAKLAEAAQNHAKAHGFTSVELRGGEVPDGWQAVTDKHCGFGRRLSADDEAELLAIPRKSRAEVRKGLKNNLEVRIGRSAQDLTAHYACYSESVRNLGTPVFPKALFRQMLEAFPAGSDILTIARDGTPLASVLSFYHNEAVLPFWGGGSFAARGARANELMYYELMRHARARGMTRFDFGRSKVGSGPAKFKKNWGFEPQPLTYGHWTPPGAEPRDVDPTSEAYSRKIELWKKLPLPVANTIGPFIARGLA